MTAAEQTAGLSTNAKVYRNHRLPQVRSNISLAARCQWKDRSVTCVISSTFPPCAYGSSCHWQCITSAVQSPAWWVGWTLGLIQCPSSFLCPCVPALGNPKKLFTASIHLTFVVLCSEYFGKEYSSLQGVFISARKCSSYLLCGLCLLSGWLCATLAVLIEQSK